VLAAVVLGVEIELAARGPDLDKTPYDLDGLIGERAGETPLRVVWLGDSTAAGVGASSPDTGVARTVATGLHRPVQLTSLAVSGDRVADVLKGQLPRVAELDPDIVLISIGSNDAVHLTGVAMFRSRYRHLLEALPASTQVVVLGVPDMGSPPRFKQPLRAMAGWLGRRLDRVVRQVALEHHARYVDIAGYTGSAFRHDPARYFSADHYHPGDAGYALWSEAVLATLTKETRP
jgi:lysophospholipase L1-like esterase